MGASSFIRSHETLFAVLAPPVRFVKRFAPSRLRADRIKKRCFTEFKKSPVIEVRQSGMVSRFHAISAKNYWHLYLNRDEMDSYVDEALRPGDVVLDIGGHVGAYTVPMAKYVGPRGTVLVFEPEDLGRTAILRNLELNSISNCRVFDTAICDFDGTISFFVRPEKDTHSIFEKSHAASPTGQLIEVTKAARTVDSLVRAGEIPQPNFIKLDIEGAELKALEGMRQTLGRTRAIYVECHETLRTDFNLGDPVELVTAKLESLGAAQIRHVDSFHVLAFFRDTP